MASPAPFPGHRGETSSVWFASTKCLLDINGTQSQCNDPGLVVRKCDCFSRSFHPQQIYQGKVLKHSSHILHLLKAKRNWIAMPHFSSISQNCHPRKARLPKSKSGGESEVEWLRNLRIVRIAGWCAKTNDELINLRPLSQCIIAVTSLNCPQRRLFRFSETKTYCLVGWLLLDIWTLFNLGKKEIFQIPDPIKTPAGTSLISKPHLSTTRVLSCCCWHSSPLVSLSIQSMDPLIGRN